MNTRLCFVRHGETAWNAERRLQGHLDIPLNANGLAQAHATARNLSRHRFDALYSSDLARAMQTAQPAAACLSLEVRLMPQLRERRYGAFEGLTYDEARERYPEAYRRFEERDADFVFPGGGESLSAFAARIHSAVATIAGQHKGQQVLVVVHGGVLDIVNRLARGLPLDAPRDFPIPNAALNWVALEDDCWRLVAWAEREHLHSALDELPNA